MANRVAPAFRFCLVNSTLIQATTIRYLFLPFVTHHRNTYIHMTPNLYAALVSFSPDPTVKDQDQIYAAKGILLDMALPPYR